ncbi:MAG: hypothetical protein ACREBS_00735, partial [Nitrososphaerales archaeon]
LSNIGREGAITVRIDEALPEDFEIVESQYSLSEGNSLSIASKIGPGLSKTLTLSAKPRSTGEFLWHPALVYLDGKRNYKITRAQTAKAVVESGEQMDLASALSEKERLENELRHVEEVTAIDDDQSHIEKVYSIKERISRIEEALLRIKNDYEKMISQLGQIRVDLSVLGSLQNKNLSSKDKTRLENEERLLKERIERRRSALEQAHLL